MANILVCDDERDIVSALKIYLAADGHTVFEAANGAQALRCVKENEIELVLMDIMMPEMNGIEATVKLREEFNIPIILLTAKSEATDKILGLDIGADDYVTKPFDPVELQARVRSQLRRYKKLGGETSKAAKKEADIYISGGVELNNISKTVTVDDEPVSLTPIEYKILLLFMQNPNRVFSSSQIYELVWNDTAMGAESSVAVHIRHIREKIEITPKEPRYIKVVWGLGYKLEGTVKINDN